MLSPNFPYHEKDTYNYILPCSLARVILRYRRASESKHILQTLIIANTYFDDEITLLRSRELVFLALFDSRNN